MSNAKKTVIAVLSILAAIFIISAINSAMNDGVTKKPAPSASPSKQDLTDDTFGSGSYEVGVDIPSGTFKTDGPPEESVIDGCYWERAKNASGDFGAIIANDYITGPSRVDVEAGEIIKFTGDCGWYKIK